MTMQSVKDFYEFTFSDKSAQEKMMAAVSVDDFVVLAVKVGNDNGFKFSVDDMWKTINKVGNKSAFDDVDFPNLWIKKIMTFGWVPLGYSR